MADRPFAEVLDSALTRRGLTLERVSDHVAAQGAQVSVSTLSLWRRGRTRPTRQRSQAALTALEAVLDLPAGELATSLQVPGAWEPEWWTIETPPAQLHSAYEAFDAFLAASAAPARRAERWQVAAVLEIDAGRRRSRARMTQVLHAPVEPVTAVPIMYWTEDTTDDDQPTMFEVSQVIGARVTKKVEFDSIGGMAALLELDEPLGVGDTTAFELTVDWVTEAPRQDELGWQFEELQMPWPVGGLTLEVRFLGEAPRRARTRIGHLLPDGAGVADAPATDVPAGALIQVSAFDVVRGGLRLEWSWAEGDEHG